MVRPTKYTDDMPERALAVFKQGLGVATVCAELGICLDTFWRFVKENKAFSDAFHMGKALQASRIEQVMLKAIVESDNKNPQNLTKYYASTQAKDFGYGPEKDEQVVTQINIGKDAMDDADLNNVLNSIRRKK